MKEELKGMIEKIKEELRKEVKDEVEKEMKEELRKEVKEELREEIWGRYKEDSRKRSEELGELQAKYARLKRKYEKRTEFPDIDKVAESTLNYFLKYRFKSNTQMQNVDKLILNKEHISPTMRESLQETFEILVWIFKEYSEKLKNTPTMVDVNPTSPETRGKKS